ncbi:MAG: hypothetical protein MUF54_09515, partial [Polyangiaceae bacterium]|nr:hypothetical protein [Polyangiaceae bacterium]
PPLSPGSPQTRQILGYSAIGAGVVSAGAAIALGLRTLSARDEFEDQKTRDAYDDATSLRVWTNVAWAGAIVLGGAGAALVLWPTGDKDKGQEQEGVALSAAPHGVLVRGSF